MRAPSAPRPRRLPVALLVLTLVGCGGGGGGDEDAGVDSGTVEAPLPQPQRAAGSVTRMPSRPGPGDVPLAGDAPAPPPVLLPADERFGLPPLEDNPETGLAPPADPATGGEPTAGDAVGVLQAYYAAINAGDFAQAYAAWSDGGRGSGQTPEQFAAGFADTTRVEVSPGAPGVVEGAAGSRYVEIPVSVVATHRDGGTHRYEGRYTLRRAVADGATPEQRAWRIASA
ncbi:MAG: hypothetical protein KIS72_11880, partial [Luteimonas sp.]|nr:hypothetical protein [Luteimonas sp.]